MPAKKVSCRNCAVRKGLRGKRWLCMKCYLDPEIRGRFPKYNSMGQVVENPEEGLADMTMEELDKMIAEQYPTTPGRCGEPDYRERSVSPIEAKRVRARASGHPTRDRGGDH